MSAQSQTQKTSFCLGGTYKCPLSATIPPVYTTPKKSQCFYKFSSLRTAKSIFHKLRSQFHRMVELIK